MSKVEQILAGQSRASVLTQDEVAELFKEGIDDKRTSSDNYRSGNGILTHYSTIEGVRTEDGTIIENLQCWSSGFAKCSLTGADYFLPLSTIRGLAPFLIRQIKVLDTEGSFVLFTMHTDLGPVKYFLYGYDDGRFLVMLPKSCSTLNEARESLKPSHTYDSTPRQGDLFFIPIYGEPEGIYEKAHFISRIQWNSELYQEIKRPRIMGTRHEAQEMITSDGITYVKGYIKHPQHKTLKLDGWHIVRMNEAITSFQVPDRGTGGGID